MVKWNTVDPTELSDEMLRAWLEFAIDFEHEEAERVLVEEQMIREEQGGRCR